MDNMHISIQSEGRAAFDLAVKLFFTSKYDRGEPDKKVTHYIDDHDKGFILLWSEDIHNKSIKLPVPLSWKPAADLAWEWLIQQPESQYKQYCDHDGSNGHGFRIYNENWGHVKSHYALFAVEPIWAWYGK
jgi:hypothetical protein